MIVDNTYFVNELYIPNAKPSVTSDITTVQSELNSFINKYERDCLIRCIGYTLYAELVSMLDLAETTLIKTGSDAKWDDLVNGKVYTINGKSLQWRGLRFKNIETDLKPNRSFIANYIYWFYEQDADVLRAGIGNVQGKAKNAERVSAAPKVSRAWNEMVKMICGEEENPRVLINTFGRVGVDYYVSNNEVDLYKFIKDSNLNTPDTYVGFTPTYWNKGVNELGI